MHNRKIRLLKKSRHSGVGSFYLKRKNIKRRIILLLMLLTFYILISNQPCQASETKKPAIKADAAILMDADSGVVYYDKNAYQRKAPASLTKIMTTVLAIENGKLQDTVTVSIKAAQIKTGSNVSLQQGDQLSLEDVLKACLLWSGNDAALAAGEHIGGSRDVFIEMMNSKAQLLGLTGTNFVNTNGYSHSEHYSTAYDLAVLSRYALKNAIFSEMVSTKYAEITWLNRDKTMELKNTNKLLFDYAGCDGIKTGTAITAGKCLAVSAKREGLKLIAIVLNSSNRYNEAAALLDYGFNNVKQQQLLKPNADFGRVSVQNGAEQEITVVTKSGLTADIIEDKIHLVQKRVELDRCPEAPVKKGQKLGEVVLVLEQCELGRVELIAAQSCRKKLWFK